MDKRYIDIYYIPDAVAGSAALVTGREDPDGAGAGGAAARMGSGQDAAPGAAPGRNRQSKLQMQAAQAIRAAEAGDSAQPMRANVSATPPRSAGPSFSGMISRRFLTVY